MARASNWTHLALDRYAAILGANPCHFNQAAGPNLMPPQSCNDVLWQYNWQEGRFISREEIAEHIVEAEEDIAAVLGYWPGPRWITAEPHNYPGHFNRMWSGNGLDIQGNPKRIITHYGRLIAPGRRALTLLGTPTTAGATLVYGDVDGDGYAETATITLTGLTVTDVREIKVYFAGENGDPEWEIRPARSKTLSGGTFTATFWVWQLIDPNLWEALPLAIENEAINIEDTSNLVTSVQVYREYNDTTQVSAVFYWLPGSCDGCALVSQNGCATVASVSQGELAVRPATYDSDSGSWADASWTTEAGNREPEQVKIYYYAGGQDDKYLTSRTSDPLSQRLAQAITWLATARLDRPLCDCATIKARMEALQRNLAHVKTGSSYQNGQQVLDNPFGTRDGEVRAWQIVDKLISDRQTMQGAAL